METREGTMETLAGLKVLVTGDTGFIGSWLSQTLVLMNAKVVGIGLKPDTNPSLFKELGLRRRIKHVTLNILDHKGFNKVVKQERPDMVFHLAAQALVRQSYLKPMETFKTNMIGTINVLEACKKAQVKSVVVATTDKVYLTGKNKEFQETDLLGGGKDAYSLSKVGADLIAQTYLDKGMQLGIARGGNVIGGGDWAKDRLLPDLMRTIYAGRKSLVIRYPEAVRVWQHVLEMVGGYLRLGVELYKGKKVAGGYNFGSKLDGQKSVIEFIKLVEKLGGKRVKIKVKQDKLKPEEEYVGLSVNKVKKKLNWQSKLSLDQALRMSLEWYERFEARESAESLCNEQIREYFGI